MRIWPLLFLCGAGVGLAALADLLSGGLPWGIDDGVKGLMAQHWVQSGGRSLSLSDTLGCLGDERFFAIPRPYAQPANGDIIGLFPALFPILGGTFEALAGRMGLHFLPALCFVLLVYLLVRLIQAKTGSMIVAWSALMLSSSLLFYGLTFWEHTLALLFSLPLMYLIAGEQTAPGRWFGAGASLGLAVYLRPEFLLLLPCILFARSASAASVHKDWPRRDGLIHMPRILLGFALALMIALALAGVLEKVTSDRWIPAQIKVNWDLMAGDFAVWRHVEQSLTLLLNSPLDWRFFGAGLLLVFVLTALLRKLSLLLLALPILSGLLLTWGWLEKGAFGLVPFSQGLFFALPWVGICFWGAPLRQKLREPLFIMGWGFLLLAFLLAPHRPGMHWGPRFLFPAMLPLLIHAAVCLQKMGAARLRAAIMTATALSALLQASASVTALAERGVAGRQAALALREQQPAWLIVDRWHAGADLEPLWKEMQIVYAPGVGSLEEILIRLQEIKVTQPLSLLRQDEPFGISRFPLRILEKVSLPHRAGWGGELASVNLEEPSDGRWGEIFWHAARRRIEEGDLKQALICFQRAVAARGHDPDLLYDYAVCLGQTGRVEEAVAKLRRALSLNPEHAAALSLWRQLTLSR
jgi:hypothetical protein